MAIIPQFFLNAVVAIGIETEEKTKHWIGTGFIVGRKEVDNPEFFTHYIITNKHVVKEQSQIYVRFNSLGGEFVKDYPINLFKENIQVYSAHPHEKTDVVAKQIRLDKLIEDKSIHGVIDLNGNALELDQMQKTGVTEGSLVYALGFPMNLVETIKAPICRLGCVSRIFDAFVNKKETPTFLVDAQTFPGNSGGPIISRPEQLSITGTPTNTSANLIGILSSYIPYRDTLYSRQTGQSVMIREENSGLTIVHPVDRIKEVVELEWKRCSPIVQVTTESVSADEQEKELVGAAK